MNGETPTSRLSVNRAYTVNDRAACYEKHAFDPLDKNGAIVASEEIIAAMSQRADERTRLVAILMEAIIVVSLLVFFLYDRLSKARLLSLLLINVLIAVFLLFIILTPEVHKKDWLAVLVFIGLFPVSLYEPFREQAGPGNAQFCLRSPDKIVPGLMQSLSHPGFEFSPAEFGED